MELLIIFMFIGGLLNWIFDDLLANKDQKEYRRWIQETKARENRDAIKITGEDDYI